MGSHQDVYPRRPRRWPLKSGRRGSFRSSWSGAPARPRGATWPSSWRRPHEEWVRRRPVAVRAVLVSQPSADDVSAPSSRVTSADDSSRRPTERCPFVRPRTPAVPSSSLIRRFLNWPRPSSMPPVTIMLPRRCRDPGRSCRPYATRAGRAIRCSQGSPRSWPTCCRGPPRPAGFRRSRTSRRSMPSGPLGPHQWRGSERFEPAFESLASPSLGGRRDPAGYWRRTRAYLVDADISPKHVGPT